MVSSYHAKKYYNSNIRFAITKCIYCRYQILENLTEKFNFETFWKYWDAIFLSIHTSDKTTASTFSRINFRRGLEVWLHTLRPHFHPFSSSYKNYIYPTMWYRNDVILTTPLTQSSHLNPTIENRHFDLTLRLFSQKLN